MKYFKNCTTLNEVKSLYRTLAKLHHPDKGGDLATMQAINNEYSKAIILMAREGVKPDGTHYTQQEQEAEILNAEAYKEALNKIMNVPGIDIELCGGWLWITPQEDANFWPLWPTMKAAGFWFAKVKRKYYFRSVEYATKNQKTKTMTEIRNKYGSQKISSTHFNYIN